MFTVSVPADCYPGERWRAGVAQLDLQERICQCSRVILSPALCLLHWLLVQNQHVGEECSESISNVLPSVFSLDMLQNSGHNSQLWVTLITILFLSHIWFSWILAAAASGWFKVRKIFHPPSDLQYFLPLGKGHAAQIGRSYGLW